MPSHHHEIAGHDHSGADVSDSGLVWSIVLNMLLTVAQIVGGIFSGSLALVADALHNFNDAISLLLALIARRIGRKQPDEIRTFGYMKAPIVGALINLTTLIIVGFYLIYESIFRYFEQAVIDGWIVVIVAGIALIVDICTAIFVYKMSKESLNMKAAFVHNLSDALASVGVIITGTLIILYQWYIADLIATLIISAYILIQGFKMIKDAIRLLMDSAPKGFSLSKMVEAVKSIDSVIDIYHVHLWQLDEKRVALEAHVIVENMSVSDTEPIKNIIKELLITEFNVDHVTLELETDHPEISDRRVVMG